jgi:hypothetical protein
MFDYNYDNKLIKLWIISKNRDDTYHVDLEYFANILTHRKKFDIIMNYEHNSQIIMKHEKLLAMSYNPDTLTKKIMTHDSDYQEYDENSMERLFINYVLEEGYFII